MEVRDININIIGNKCLCYMLGRPTSGVITAIEGETIKITFDYPIRWGNDVFYNSWFSENQLKLVIIY